MKVKGIYKKGIGFIICTSICLIAATTSVMAERQIMFGEQEPKFKILNEYAENSDTDTTAYNTDDVFRIVEQSFNSLTRSSSQDSRIMKVLDITNMMSKELGTDFVENNLDLFTEGNGWQVELTATDTKDTDNVRFLIVLSPTEEYMRLKILEFGIQGSNITTWTSK